MITPVLLAGGSGTRLWPLSRRSYPKQFAELTGPVTLFQATAERLSGAGFAPPLVLTQSDFRFIATEQLAAVGIDPGAVMLEPEGRNTAPAVLAAALWLRREAGEEALMLVAPSDHVIADAQAFQEAIAGAELAARRGRLVTFGITPDRAETGYGYLEPSQESGVGGPVPLVRFIEKPDLVRARALYESGDYLWNSGLFLFSAGAILEAARTHAPSLLARVEAAFAAARADLGFLRLDPDTWGDAPDISIDYAIMERAGCVSVMPVQAGWSDLGDWEAVRRAAPAARSDGVALSGAATAIDCRDSLLRSEDPRLQMVGIGLEDVIAVAMPDAVLVAHRSRAQDVKAAVNALKARDAAQATDFPRDHRPWGGFESLVTGDRFQVKRITVKPGAALSLQSHHHRAEHWIVVQGTALVTLGKEARLVTENESVYIPIGETHRLENPGMMPMVLIEVQTGAYLGEDDIIRYEDVYMRAVGE
ncbi:mannose-1-phosphate guanylyltransferase/mannose-6-phosphate isomerase [Thioclava sp. JM3]|uniref:mannose-1-phosphate guanylyltransferase/mannose-6-phosphate isomerase n=1 Tax=Thioclava sp. JM3 TaxID=1973004 RepID=UPI000B544827|nr:mannose-1-phosphate guanylyltransferase/mannose-6-phosphate isomerase [Thioclava sp. JM3]OWY18366.1 mannose-1-phosphate guanylyltransferase/mannose-6-phosphate isomerase [Thioclava sp. JM3]